MRKLTEFSEARRASDLVDTLLSHGVEGQVRGAAGNEVWVLDHDKLARAGELLKEFEVHGKSAGSADAERIRKEQARVQAARDHNFVHVRSTLRGAPEDPGFGPVTGFLILCSVLVSIFSNMGDPETITIRNLVIEPEFGAPFLASVRAGEVWRLVTPMFIHFGVLHLLFNMSGVWRFSRQIEQQQGPLVLLALVLWTQVPGIVGQYALAHVQHQNAVIGGMSGVLFGMFGFVWMQARYGRKYAYFIDEPTTWLMMIWFVLCVTGVVGEIANVAHAAGLIAGLIAGLPAYITVLRARAANPEFQEHSWADVHIRGKTRLYRQFVAPYAPLWLLAIAAVVIALDR